MNVFDLFAKISLDTKPYETALSGAKSLAGTVMDGIGGIFSRAADLAVSALSTAANAAKGFVADSVQTGMIFDKAMSQVAATMGKTSEEVTELREFAREMGAQTKYSATEAAEALNYMALAGYDTATSIAMLPNVLNLAAAGNFALARASDMVTDTQTAFGLTIERTTQMVDEMAKAASTGNTSVEQLGDAFLTVGGLAKELNGGMVTLADGTKAEVDGVQELEIALTAMANAGIKGSEAGTHMRNMLLKLTSPTSDGIEAFTELGVSVFDASGKMNSMKDIFGDLSKALSKLTQEEKLKRISALFNARDTASAEALLAAVGQDWDKIGAAILDSAGAAEKMAETQLDNLAGDTQILKSAMDELKISISDLVTPALRGLAKSGTAAIQNLAKAVKSYGIREGIEQWFDLESIIYTKKWNKIWPEIRSLGENVVTNLKNGILENAGAVGAAIPEILTKFGEKITDPEAFSKITGYASQVVGNFAAGLFSQESMDTLLDTEHGLPKFIENVGENMATLSFKLLDGVHNMIESFTEYMLDEENREKIYTAAGDILVELGSSFVKNVFRSYEFLGEVMADIAKHLVGEFDADATAGELIWALGKALVGKIKDWSTIGLIKGAVEYFRETGAEMDLQNDYLNDPNATGTFDDYIAARQSSAIRLPEKQSGIIRKFDIAEPARNSAVSVGENFSISFGDIHVDGGQDAGEEVIRQIDRALRQLQTRQQRGIGGAAWQF